jgi:hypothetical protein
MRLLRWVLMALLGVAAIASCSRLPQSTRSGEQMTSIREEYLRNHPDGRFNTLIMEGRVVKGMGIIEVLASWGIPNDRRSNGAGRTEYWAYYAKDEHTQRFVSYELVFESNELTRWVVNTDLPTALGTVPGGPDATRTIEETLRLGGAVQPKDAPTKK